MAATVHQASALGSPNGPINPAGQPCFGCGRAIDADQHGLVIALRDSLWHMDCFVCSHCKKKVHPEMTLLILADGSPVCMDCTYQCAACGLPIQDEAVMTGDLTYHSNCFKCQQCQKKIEDLVFAKTNHGIYCMPCHNEKAARSRRHMERKKSKRRKERPEGESPVPPLPGKSMSGPIGGGSVTTPTSSKANSSASANGFPPPSPVVTPVASTSANTAVSPTSTHFYTPNTTPFLDSATEFPSAKRTSFSLEPGRNDVDVRSHRMSYAPARTPSPLSVAPPSVSTTSWDDPQATSAKPPSPAPSPTGLGFNIPQAGRSLVPPSTRSGGISSHPNRRSAMMNGFLMSDPSDIHRRSNYSPDGLSPEPSNRSLSPAPPSLRSSPSPSSFHSANPSPEGGRSNSPSLLSHNPHSFPPTHFRSRSREPSPAREKSDPYDSGDVPPTPPPKEWRGRNRDAEMNGVVGLGMGMDLSDEVILIDSENREPPEGDYPEDLTRSSMDEADDMVGESTRLSAVIPDLDTPEEQEEDQQTTLAPPALPPMRFSLYGTDFSDILKRVAASDSSRDLMDLATGPSPAASALLQVESLQPASAPASGGGFSDLRLSSSRGSGSTARDSKDATPTGLRHIVTSPSLTSIASVNRGGSTSAPAMSKSFLDGLPRPPPASSPSPRLSFSHSDASGGEEDDVLGPLSAVSMNSTAIPTSPSPEPALSAEAVLQKLRDAIRDGEGRGGQVKMDMGLAVGLLAALESMTEKYSTLKTQYDGVKRKSQHYVKGLNVAGAEYDRELTHRREVEAEVTRLRLRVSDQAAKLTMLEAPERETKRLANQGRMLKEEMSNLQHTVSKLKVERDVVVAEVEQLAVSKSDASSLEPLGASTDAVSLRASHSLSQRLEEVKADYSRDLEALQQQREALAREVQELQDARQQCLEETATLQARNEELGTLMGQLHAQTETRGDHGHVSPPPRDQSRTTAPAPYLVSPTPGSRLRRADESMASVTTTSTNMTSSYLGHEDRDESQRFVKIEKVDVHTQEPPAAATTAARRFRWYNKSSSNPSAVANAKGSVPPSNTPTPPLINGNERPNPLGGHNFQQHSILRLTRCEYCGEKMWGLHLRCADCGVVSHARCQAYVRTQCRRPSMERAPSSDSTIFGRDLVEQVRADERDDPRLTPVIVEKCIDALELRGMDYEGIYRKTGGSSQCKNITQLFEKGGYDSFDLNDPQAFNDVSSITSVLKTWFRSLPNPLFTHALHDKFVTAGENNDPVIRGSSLTALIKQLPPEHYETVKLLMLHLHRVTNLSDVNRMNSQNLGVVFGPTLMRSQDRSREFTDMSGETQTVRWLIENAPVVFADPERDGP